MYLNLFRFISGLKDPNLDRHTTKGKQAVFLIVFISYVKPGKIKNILGPLLKPKLSK